MSVSAISYIPRAFEHLSPVWSEDFRAWFSDVVDNADVGARNAVFDLDNTILIGDIGEETFAQLVAQKKLRWQESLELAPKHVLNCLRGRSSQNSSLLALYRAAVSQARSRPMAECDTHLEEIYRWMVRVMVGLRVEDVESAAQEALRKCKLNSAVAELLLELMSEKFSIWIISASDHWSVRQAVSRLLNPYLIRCGGAAVPIGHVFGVVSYLFDSRLFLLNEPREKARTVSVNLDPQNLSGYRLSSCLLEPAPAFDGKAELVQSLLSTQVQLAVGDSFGDFAMAEVAKYKLFVPRANDLLTKNRLQRKAWGESLFLANL